MSEDPSDQSARSALRRHQLRPRKSLGQNFLKDRRYLRTIVEALQPEPEDEVLEIGPGTGVLTAALLAVVQRVVAVELDPFLVAALRTDFSGSPNLEVVQGDALDFDPSAYFSVPYKFAGNIPYYITGPILRHYLELPHPPEIMVLMVQREVADRMVAQPGDMSLLGVSVQFYGNPRIVARVPRRAFHPAPRVDSAIVKIVPRPSPVGPDRREDFFRLAHAGFGTKRKTLENGLRIGLGLSRDSAQGLLSAASIDGGRRAETLSVDDWVRLTEAFEGGAD